MTSIDNLCVNTLRFLAVDAVEKANSGHPGLPLGAAPMAYVVWDRCLRHHPGNPLWFDRDRFVLSAGHGSALLYALLHVYGYGLSIGDIKNFRQWGSKTPGHPERGLTPGIEVTTGPLGQGFAMGVGMAIAERFLADLFTPHEEGLDPIIDHYTYAIVSDGDLMEGVSSEAASLAGHLGLGKLIYLYDDNHITIDGSTTLAFTEDAAKRFEAYGWHVQSVEDGNDIGAIERAIRNAKLESRRPSLVCVRTHIGYGSPKQDSAAAHGEPLGADAARATKHALDWPLDPPFYVPDAAAEHFTEARDRGAALERDWIARLAAYRQRFPEKAAQLDRTIRGVLPDGWREALPVFHPGDGAVATRDASGKVLNAIAERLPMLIGGSADLAPSNKSYLLSYPAVARGQPAGRNIHFGVREHAMGAIVNGMACHGGVIPYGSTFLVFSDYMRPALRLASLMQSKSIFVFTHDSVGLGEDGPTHQPIEHLASLRAIPGLTVIRPADANETAVAWRLAIELDGPVALMLTRQKLPVLDPNVYRIAEGVPRGAYVLSEASGGPPDVILVATGSEVTLVLAAQRVLNEKGVRARVVSMPSWEIFERQTEEFRRDVLPPGVPKLAVEAGVPLGWRRYVGDSGDVIGIARFGGSAAGDVVMEKLGLSVDHVVERVLTLVRE